MCFGRLAFSDERAGASIRIGIGRMTTGSEIDRAADLLAAAAIELGRAGEKLRANPI